MRRFKFIGNSIEYGDGDEFEKNSDYPETHRDIFGRGVAGLANNFPSDWQEVFENESPWISVKDRLPEEGGRYWCYVKEINDLGISYYQWNCSYHEIEKMWAEDKSNIVPFVTHWMPLPEPPKQ